MWMFILSIYTCMLQVRLHMSSNIKLCFHRCVTITKCVGWNSLFNSNNSMFINKSRSTVVSFLLCIWRLTTLSVNCFIINVLSKSNTLLLLSILTVSKRYSASFWLHAFSLYIHRLCTYYTFSSYRLYCPLICCV